MEDQQLLFATDRVNDFDVGTPASFFPHDVAGGKAYVQKYFIKCDVPACPILWMPSMKELRSLNMLYIRQNYLLKTFSWFDAATGQKLNIGEWFFLHEYTRVICEIDPAKPPTWKENGRWKVNEFQGYRFQQPKPFNTFPQHVTDAVKKVWDHIKNAWCSEKQDQYDYVCEYITSLVAGRKLETALYLKSGQGTGKSIIVQFLMELMGLHCTYSTANTKVVTEDFNAQLKGVVLCCLEEVPAAHTSAWDNFYSKIKDYVTGKRFQLHPKFEKPYMIANHVSWILLTNNNAIAIASDDRRLMCLDLSHEYVGKHAYFKELAAILKDPLVQEAFYSFCKETAPGPDWREDDHPGTKTKQNLINKNLHPVMQAIKDEYVLQHRGITGLFADFYQEYQDWSTSHGKRAICKQDVAEICRQNGLQLFKKGQNKLYIEASEDHLVKYFKMKKWFVETDEFDEMIPAPAPEQNEIKNLKDTAFNKEAVALRNIMKKCQKLTDEYNLNKDKDEKDCIKREQFLARLKAEECELLIEVSTQKKNPMYKIAQTPEIQVDRVEDTDIMNLF